MLKYISGVLKIKRKKNNKNRTEPKTVTLNTGVMMPENLAVHHGKKLYFKVHSNRKSLF